MLPCDKSFRSEIYPVKILQIPESFSIEPAAGIHQWKYCEKSVGVFVHSL